METNKGVKSCDLSSYDKWSCLELSPFNKSWRTVMSVPLDKRGDGESSQTERSTVVANIVRKIIVTGA